MGEVTAAATRDLRNLERLRTTIPVRAGTVLVGEGRRSLQFGVVLEGTALVTRHGRALALLESGESFGEIGLVREVPSPVTIVACTDATLAVMNVREFHSAYTTMPAFRDHVDDQMEARLAVWIDADDDYTLAS